jgi:hypothetical protein
MNHQLKKIEAYAFQGFTVDYVLFSDTTVEIERNAFTKGTILFTEEREAYEHVELESSESLTLIYGVDEVIVDSGMVFYIKDGQAHLIKVQTYESELVIPAYINSYPVMTILPYALEGVNLYSLSFEEGSLVNKIDDHACEDMTVVGDIILPSSVLRIGNKAFAFVEAHSILIPSDELIIETEAFMYANITRIYFPMLTTASTFQANWNPQNIPYVFGNV